MEYDIKHDELKDFVKESGLIFDDEQDEKSFLDIVVAELELRIGKSIYSRCSPQEIKDYELFSDICAKKMWLEEHVPQYKLIIRRHIIKIKSEIRGNVDYINSQKEKQRKSQG